MAVEDPGGQRERRRNDPDIRASAALTYEAESERMRVVAIFTHVVDEALASYPKAAEARELLKAVCEALKAARDGTTPEAFILKQSE